MASFRSGFKIVIDLSRRKGRGLFQRAFSEDRSAFARWQAVNKEQRNAVVECPVDTRPTRNLSRFSLWKCDNDLDKDYDRGRKSTQNEDSNLRDTSLVCSIPVTRITARCEKSSTSGIDKMFDLQMKHLHPKQAVQQSKSLVEGPKKLPKAEFKAIDCEHFSHEPYEFPLTPKQISFIQRFQHTSICSMDALKTVEPPKQMYTRFKKMDLDTREENSLKSNCNPIAMHYSTAGPTRLNHNLKLSASFATGIMNDPLNKQQKFVYSTRNYSDLKADPPFNNVSAIEPQKKKDGEKKPNCQKVPSGIEGSSNSSSSNCDKFKMPGCSIPKSTDCKPKPIKIGKCTKLEAPFPSYSECVKDPAPPIKQTECPSEHREAAKECREESEGLSYDGCNPPAPKIHICIPKENQKPQKSKPKECINNPTKCDVKPFKEAGAGRSRQPMKCSSASTITWVSEPKLVIQQFFPLKRHYSLCKIDPPNQKKVIFECSDKKEEGSKANYFKEKTVQKSIKKEDEASPVSSSVRNEKSNVSDKPGAEFHAWKVCTKPTNAKRRYKCPEKPKKAYVKPKEKLVPCDTPITPMPTFKKCPKPTKPRKRIYRCVESGPPPPPPPEPKTPRSSRPTERKGSVPESQTSTKKL